MTRTEPMAPGYRLTVAKAGTLRAVRVEVTEAREQPGHRQQRAILASVRVNGGEELLALTQRVPFANAYAISVVLKRDVEVQAGDVVECVISEGRATVSAVFEEPP